MRELPILFGTEMVKAILDGRKTVTRRVIIPQPVVIKRDKDDPHQDSVLYKVEAFGRFKGQICGGTLTKEQFTKYARYQKGDLLYVREAFLIMDWANRDRIDCDHSDIHIQYKASGSDYRPDNKRYIGRSILKHCPEHIDDAVNIFLNAGANSKHAWRLPWKPSIHMPKWAARTWLEVVSVRAEWLQGITVEDAEKEGLSSCVVDPYPRGCFLGVTGNYAKNYIDEIDMFMDLWDSLNAKRGYGWDVNPWVWRYEFKKIQHEK